MPPRWRKNQAEMEPNIGWLWEKVLSLSFHVSHRVVAPFSSIQPQEGKVLRSARAIGEIVAAVLRELFQQKPRAVDAGGEAGAVRGSGELGDEFIEHALRAASGAARRSRGPATCSDCDPPPTLPVFASRNAFAHAAADSSAILSKRTASFSLPMMRASRAMRRAVSMNIGVVITGPAMRGSAS